PRRPHHSFPTRRSSDLGAYITKHYVRDIGPANLLVISAIMFAVAGFLIRFFPGGFAEQNKIVPAREEPIGGSIWSGITHIARSRSEEHTSELQSRVDLV